MKAILYMYDIPSTVSPKDYPGPSRTLRKFAAHLQTCWVVPLGMISETESVTEDLRLVGATVDMVEFAEHEEGKIFSLARKYIEKEAVRIRKYIETSIETTTKKLADALAVMSIHDTNVAISYQRSAIQRARTELADAESCAVAFDLLGEMSELLRGVRSTVEARASEFILERKTARATAKAASGGNGNTTGDNQTEPAPSATTSMPDTVLPFGAVPASTVTPDNTEDDA